MADSSPENVTAGQATFEENIARIWEQIIGFAQGSASHFFGARRPESACGGCLPGRAAVAE